MTKAMSIAGRNAGVAETPQLYETPPEATRALLRADPYFRAPRVLVEPCCGPGRLVRALEDGGHRVIASDKYQYAGRYVGRAAPTWRRDFFDTRGFVVARNDFAIVTNPPYAQAAAFAVHALDVVKAPRVYLLLELGFLQGGGGGSHMTCPHRDRLIDGGDLTGVFAFRERINDMHRDGFTGPRVSTTRRHAWFRWERGAKRGVADFRRISLDPDYKGPAS